MKRLLMIAGVYPPAGGAGVIRLAKISYHLAELGWEVDVIAPKDGGGYFSDPDLGLSHPRLRVWRVPGRLNASLLKSSVVERLRSEAKSLDRNQTLLSRLSSHILVGPKFIRDMMAIPDDRLAFSLAALRFATQKFSSDKFDIILTSSFPYSAHLTGMGLAHIWKTPWVADMRDPWAGHSFRGQNFPGRRKLDHYLERQLIRQADALTLTSPGLKAQLLERYDESELERRFFVIENGFAVYPRFNVPSPPQNKPLEILYTGSFYSQLTAPDTLLQAFSLLFKQRPDYRGRVRLRVIGSADMESSRTIRRWQQKENDSGTIVVEPPRAYSLLPPALVSADILWLAAQKDARWFIPAKVFDYLGSGTPILASAGDGDVAALLRKTGGAQIVDPDSPQLLADILSKAIEKGHMDTEPRNTNLIRRYEWS
ncbi:glycosyltransferase, partial [Myxococcota bacterium]|nr:glycosyltransferase [Myxococcota bacterium]